jgi:hypothetical protein
LSSPWFGSKLQSKELQERLIKLQEIADQKAYKELVKDITQHDHDEERVYFSSYREQLGFGLHVVLIMFTGYIFGYTIFRSQFQNSPALVSVYFPQKSSSLSA